MTEDCGKTMKRRVPLRESPEDLENESCGYMIGSSALYFISELVIYGWVLILLGHLSSCNGS